MNRHIPSKAMLHRMLGRSMLDVIEEHTGLDTGGIR